MSHSNESTAIEVKNFNDSEALKLDVDKPMQLQPYFERDQHEAIWNRYKKAWQIAEDEPDQLSPSGKSEELKTLPAREGMWEFLNTLLKIGGWTAAMVLSFAPILIAFRGVLLPLLAVGSPTVAVILAIYVGSFLFICGLCALISVIKRRA